MNIVNLTPHAIHINGRTFEPDGIVARLTELTVWAGNTCDGIDLVHKTYAEAVHLPEPSSEILYIVSSMVRERYPDRKDLASPGDLIRDGEGKIIGCSNLVIN